MLFCVADCNSKFVWIKFMAKVTFVWTVSFELNVEITSFVIFNINSGHASKL